MKAYRGHNVIRLEIVSGGKFLNHEERVNLASKLTELLLKRYRDEILLGGIYGSTAKGTDTEYSDLEMFFIVKNESKAKSFSFAYESMPVNVCVRKLAEVEKDINEIELDWPLKMGRLFNLKITCGDATIWKRFRRLLEKISGEKINEFIAKETPLCYEGLGRLKAVKIRGNTHEIGLFVAEVLMEFMLLTAIFNREFINHDYLGGLPESFTFKYLPKDFKKIATKLMKWKTLNIDETIQLADKFVQNFVSFMAEKGIEVKEHTPLEKVAIYCEKDRAKYEVLSIN
ncbi:MAG: hypothetical protein OEY95_00900 [Candidatus Bathyarchaeota archaeon]|nr:hypothetical protein [Candidatus Bathyarchaeota archaeon]